MVCEKAFYIYSVDVRVLTTSAQIRVRLILKQLPLTHSGDSVFAAGNFNNWQPHDPHDVFSRQSDGAEILDLNLIPGYYAYKITRGAWDKVEYASAGHDVGDRDMKITHDTTIEISVEAWRDDFKQPKIEKRHTRSPQVTIMDTAFEMPQLGRKRRIWVYLPIGYATSHDKYPVLYMHDGQNLFDEFTAGFGEWGVDECLDSMHAKGLDCIVVGIDNGPKRMNEYNPYEFQKFGKGEGNEYIDFIVKTLKPSIDARFHTLKDKKHTFIAGSSMGGLISMVAVMRYPRVFGGAGIFSPAFWTAPELRSDLTKVAPKIHSKLFFYAGGSESDRMVPDMKEVEAVLSQKSSSVEKEEVDPPAKHNEAAWRKYFPEFFVWMMENN